MCACVVCVVYVSVCVCVCMRACMRACVNRFGVDALEAFVMCVSKLLVGWCLSVSSGAQCSLSLSLSLSNKKKEVYSGAQCEVSRAGGGRRSPHRGPKRL